MSAYDNRSLSSDLDTYKHEKDIKTTTLTISGVVAGAGSGSWSSPVLDITGLDFAGASFDNSSIHPGKYKELVGETYAQFVTTASSPFTEAGLINYTINGDDLQFHVTWNNPSGSADTITSTTLTIRYVGFVTTLA